MVTSTRHVQSNGIQINVATAGQGPTLLLLHGWPHTWRVWEPVLPALAATHRVVAMDLRGLGASDTPSEGYDLHTLASDAVGVLDTMDVERAAVVGIDLGVPVAWMAAMRHPSRITRLAVMEGLLGTLPGAEDFLAGGPPWWFGFHGVPGLAETVLAGHEGEYVDFFLRAGTHDGGGVSPAARAAFIAAYEQPGSFQCGLRHYRELPANAGLIAEAAADHELGMPVLALGGNVVADALARQLEPITHDLRAAVIPDCGHIVPQDSPAALIAQLLPFLREGSKPAHVEQP